MPPIRPRPTAPGRSTVPEVGSGPPRSASAWFSRAVGAGDRDVFADPYLQADRGKASWSVPG
ncbi:ABC transporter domain protein [Mycobacterium xenopi 3993]|nr:ABC transporter domain protein [Mycobacterium xenopi 3993]